VTRAAIQRWEGAELARASREPAGTPPPTLFGAVLPARAGGPGREHFVGATLLAVALHAGALLALGASTSTRMGQTVSTGRGGDAREVEVRFMVPRPSGPRASAASVQPPVASRPATVRRRMARPAPALPSPAPEHPVAPREPAVAEAEGTQEAPANGVEHAVAESASSSEAGQGGGGMLGGGATGSFEGQGGLVPPPPPPPALTREQRQSLTSRYLQELFRSRIATRFHYPEEAEHLGLEGLVTLRVSIDRSGQLLGLRVQGPCPHPLLCDAALRTVRESVPFPPPPAALGGSIAVDVPFQYRLE
jgi:periplasmic protein TonB